jgi:hypothetical protein
MRHGDSVGVVVVAAEWTQKLNSHASGWRRARYVVREREVARGSSAMAEPNQFSPAWPACLSTPPPPSPPSRSPLRRHVRRRAAQPHVRAGVWPRSARPRCAPLMRTGQCRRVDDVPDAVLGPAQGRTRLHQGCALATRGGRGPGLTRSQAARARSWKCPRPRRASTDTPRSTSSPST